MRPVLVTHSRRLWDSFVWSSQTSWASHQNDQNPFFLILIISDYPKLFERVTKMVKSLAGIFLVGCKRKTLSWSQKTLPCQMQRRRCRHRGWCVLCAGNRFPPSEVAFGQKHCWPSMLNKKLSIKLWNIFECPKDEMFDSKNSKQKTFKIIQFGMFFHRVVALGWRRRWKYPGCWGGTLGMNPESESVWAKTKLDQNRWTLALKTNLSRSMIMIITPFLIHIQREYDMPTRPRKRKTLQSKLGISQYKDRQLGSTSGL